MPKFCSINETGYSFLLSGIFLTNAIIAEMIGVKIFLARLHWGLLRPIEHHGIHDGL